MCKDGFCGKNIFYSTETEHEVTTKPIYVVLSNCLCLVLYRNVYTKCSVLSNVLCKCFVPNLKAYSTVSC